MLVGLKFCHIVSLGSFLPFVSVVGFLRAWFLVWHVGLRVVFVLLFEMDNHLLERTNCISFCHVRNVENFVIEK